MSNLLHRIGGDLNREDMISLFAWVAIPLMIVALFVVSSLLHSSSLAIISMILLGAFAIYLIATGSYGLIHDLISRRWDNMHSDERMEAKR